MSPPGNGREIIASIDARLRAKAKSAAVELVAFQSDHEDALIERVRAAADEGVGFIVIDPAGLTHSSVSLRAALSSAAIPFIEVHLANVHAREPFRQRSVASDKVVGTIVGLGAHGYELALTYALGLTSGKTGRPSAYSCHQNNLESSWCNRSVALARFWQVVSYEPLWILGFRLPAKLCPGYGYCPAELLAPPSPGRS